MSGLVETWSHQIGWQVRKHNVLVEGLSDVTYIALAERLYKAAWNKPLLGPDLAVVAAGIADDGGVDGVNRRLNAARQMADADRGPEGELRHRFIGLFDNDRAGRRALARACEFDRRLVPYQDVFLLQPVMPVAVAQGVARLRADGVALNKGLEPLDWEIEDLLSQRLLESFEQIFPDYILDTHNVRGKYHREFTRQGKVELRKYALAHATIADVDDILKLVKALRSYFALSHADISV